MKVIDLLNKIANGEEIPEKFKFAGQTFEKQGSYIEDADGDSIFDSMFTDFSNINDEVEIVEENKKIEKLEIVHNGSANAYALLNEYGTKCALTKHSKVMCDKINEIIDKLNEMEKE